MRNFIKNTTLSILIVSFLTSSFFFGLPAKKANALFGIGDITFDPSNFAQQVISVANTTATSLSTYSLQYKAFVLDTLATMLAKQLIRQITASVVDWINSGFKGSPSFLTNPGSFFADVADQFTGEWLSQFGGPLNALCSPFSIDIRLAIAFKYHPSIRKRYTCTLGQIIANTTGKDPYGKDHQAYLNSIGAQQLGNGTSILDRTTVNGASVSSFMDGNFNNGGWPAFVTMTTEPSNNVYGAYLSADSDISLSVANSKVQHRDELTQGRGFLSWKKCNQYANDVVDQGAAVDWETGDLIKSNGATTDWETGELIDKSNGGRGRCIKEEVQTPGSVIETQLEEHVGGPIRELQLVDSINEIVNALAAQLVTQVLQKGLRSISGGGPSDSTAYIRQVQAEAASVNNTQMTRVRNDFTKSISTYLTYAFQYKTNKDASFNLMTAVNNAYTGVKLCYQQKINSGSLSEYQKTLAGQRIAQVDNKIASDVSPKLTVLFSDKNDADSRYSTLQALQTKADNAKTLSDVNDASVQFSQMLQSQSLTTQKDVATSQNELDDTKSTAATLQTDANQKQNECNVFPTVINDF